MHGMKDDSGWKNVYGDVFRAPNNLVLFSAFLGTGWQLLLLVLVVILYAMAGPILHGNMYEDRGEMVSTFIVSYSLSSAFAGYTSGSFYRQYFPTSREEKASQWQRTMFCTIILFPSIICFVAMLLNMIAVHYNTLGVISIGVILKMAAIWLFVALPLSVVGTIFGRHWAGKSDTPCRVNNILALFPWLLGTQILCLLFLPQESYPSARSSSKCTSCSRASGVTNSTMFTGSCYWCTSSWPWSRFAPRLCPYTFS